MTSFLDRSLIARLATSIEMNAALDNALKSDAKVCQKAEFARARKFNHDDLLAQIRHLELNFKADLRSYADATQAELENRVVFRKNDMERRVRHNEAHRLAREEAARVARLAAQKKLKMAA